MSKFSITERYAGPIESGWRVSDGFAPRDIIIPDVLWVNTPVIGMLCKNLPLGEDGRFRFAAVPPSGEWPLRAHP